MIGKLDDNPIFLLYKAISNEIQNYSYSNFNIGRFDGYTDIDKVFQYILINNGCMINADGLDILQKTVSIIQDEYNVCFITGMMGNGANIYYDFIMFNGTKNLIIFIDYFKMKNLKDYKNDTDEYPLSSLKTLMGYSIYYHAIKKLVELFYLTIDPIPGGLLTSAMASTQRWNQAIVAIHIISYFKTVDENDVDDVPLDDVVSIAQGNIELQLYGIRSMPQI